MSVIATKTRTELEVAAVTGRIEAITSVVAAFARFLRRAAMTSLRLFTHAVEAVAEARMQRAAIEAELYLNRYKHSSKNDDDLPIVR
jgi:hypothetical protein